MNEILHTTVYISYYVYHTNIDNYIQHDRLYTESWDETHSSIALSYVCLLWNACGTRRTHSLYNLMRAAK